MQWDKIESAYKTYVFDCDGVILNSNHIKSNAFVKSVSHFGEEKTNAFIDFHKKNGGITRQVKFEYFCSNILGLKEYEKLHGELLKTYSDIVSQELLNADLIPGVEGFLQKLQASNSICFVVTGGNQDETLSVLKEKKILAYFKEVLGNPTSKRDNLLRLNNENYFKAGGIYFGDSELDQILAKEFCLDFLCIYGFSEWLRIPEDISKAKDFDSRIEFNGI